MNFKPICSSCRFFMDGACEKHLEGYPDDETLKRGGGMCPDFALRENIGKEDKPAEIGDAWVCWRCGEEFNLARGRRPIICPNPNCGKRGPFKALSGPFQFFDGWKFIPKRLAEELMEKRCFKTHIQSHVIWTYGDGFYAPDGEEFIRSEAREMLGELAREAYINEVVAHIRETTFTPANQFNPPLNLINLQKGTLNTETGELVPHTPDSIFPNEA